MEIYLAREDIWENGIVQLHSSQARLVIVMMLMMESCSRAASLETYLVQALPKSAQYVVQVGTLHGQEQNPARRGRVRTREIGQLLVQALDGMEMHADVVAIYHAVATQVLMLVRSVRHSGDV